MFKKNGQQKASFNGRIQQYSDGDCRTMKVLEEQIVGNFFKNKRKRKHRYYTGRMHHKLFYTYGEVCESKVRETGKPKGIDKHIIELKKLIFQPGEKANVPLIGKKMAIFSKKMEPYYNYSIQSAAYKDKTDCYVFTAEVRPEYAKRKKGKTVIKILKTYFEKENWQIVAREYKLQYKSPLFDFDVHMNVELTLFDKRYVPEKIEYDGFWDIPARRPEISKFTLTFYQFERAEALSKS